MADTRESLSVTFRVFAETWAIVWSWLWHLHMKAKTSPLGLIAKSAQMPDGLVVFDGRGRMADINPAARRMLGCKNERLTLPALEERYPALRALASSPSKTQEGIVIRSEEEKQAVRVRRVVLGRRKGDLYILHEESPLVAPTTINRHRLRQGGRPLPVLLPVCCGCRRVRNEAGEWQYLETYIQDYAGVALSHGLCPACTMRLYGEEFQNVASQF